MDKINIGVNGYQYPMPVCLVGTIVEGKINFMAVGWFSRLNGRPPIIGIGVNKRHFTSVGIKQNSCFSVNIPSAEWMVETDYCGIASGWKTDKSDIFEPFYGELKNAPMIKEFPLCMECRLYDTVELPSHNLFLGEIMGIYTEEQYLTEGKPDVRKMKPFVFTMPDDNYWLLGDFLGKAYKSGLKLRKQI